MLTNKDKQVIIGTLILALSATIAILVMTIVKDVGESQATKKNFLEIENHEYFSEYNRENLNISEKDTRVIKVVFGKETETADSRNALVNYLSNIGGEMVSFNGITDNPLGESAKVEYRGADNVYEIKVPVNSLSSKEIEDAVVKYSKYIELCEK